MTSENARLAAENATLTRNVQDAQTESKSLSTKLAAARASSAHDAKQVPGSAVKRQDTKAAAPAATEVAMLKLKEELYGDLTGLILNGVKRLDGEDIYDCIQTGRNGSELIPSIRYRSERFADTLQPCISISLSALWQATTAPSMQMLSLRTHPSLMRRMTVT